MSLRDKLTAFLAVGQLHPEAADLMNALVEEGEKLRADLLEAHNEFAKNISASVLDAKDQVEKLGADAQDVRSRLAKCEEFCKPVEGVAVADGGPDLASRVARLETLLSIPAEQPPPP